MKVLHICSGNFEKSFEVSRVFVNELIDSLDKHEVDSDIFLIKGKGYWGYFISIIQLWGKLLRGKYDLIHAYYGLSGFVACMSINIPVIVSFLGSDVNNKKERRISRIAYKLSSYSIFVEKRLSERIKAKKSFSIIPFGVDINEFKPSGKTEARKILGFPESDKIIMFSSSFTRREKNYPLAANAIELTGMDVRVIELNKNYSKAEMSLLYNAADIFLMTSLNEGSPQTIKEAMSCNCPIVSTDVGDVKKVTGEMNGCYISQCEPNDVAQKIKSAFEFSNFHGRTNGRERIKELRLDKENIAESVVSVYKEVLGKNK
jgi:teichuronic acid biosynthesis glycosyltransferase TuaC